MSKRRLDDVQTANAPPEKRVRADDSRKKDLLSGLSDELILHILSFLPTQSLSICQRLSHRFHGLAGDSELWKQKYYSRWVWPRARRIRHLKDSGLASSTTPRPIGYTPRPSRWIGHEHLATNLENTDWKKQYRLRHNWSKGSCRVTEVEVAQPSVPPVLVKLCKGVVFTADAGNGLRAWTTGDTKLCLAKLSFSDMREGKGSCSAPTAISVTAEDGPHGDFEVIVGFEDGSYSVYSLSCDSARFHFRYSHPASSNGAITALASSSSYLFALSQNQTVSLYRFCAFAKGKGEVQEQTMKSPTLIASLKAHNIYAPLSLSIRSLATEIIASIVYSFPRIGCGWSVGLQELRLNHDGENLGSRLATTVDLQFCASPFNSPTIKILNNRGNGKTRHNIHRNSGKNDSIVISTSSAPLSPCLSYTQPPTSISYSHPYLLTSHADNTLTMYLVVSTADALMIKTGRRLWGHTSSVSGVQVSERGRAVSVSSRGGEIRIWELEDMISSSFPSARMVRRDSSVQISAENENRNGNGNDETSADADADADADTGRWKRRRLQQPLELVSEAIERRGDGLGLALQDVSRELALAARMRGWVGFDDERVVVLRERELGTQLLGCYDFT
ncbi:F-box domain-containing protein [Blastomyces dermatitidis ER-3]|uniref:Probable E3 ubiquitin ligase complex SCF subunit sconB n=1 Tax=Ajellomyces dermatitidis (strain ER-3 / ATCC MYA-2586) TaxID=559297 RepID=A0ABP2F1F4_AJEDR|nr:F-box domain-containing protein [Blastomyces dermatitidis ER-3]EEQ90558.1 F-box domain-containing protein [Blastomyces dermatitidis ER-3]